MTSESSPDKMYNRCAYLNCFNGKNSTGHRLYRFPAYSDSRHNIWIRYTGNSRVRTWSSATIRRSGICGDHFDRESFTDESRHSLRRHAVPKPYSATDTKAKATPTLLAHIKSLPRECTRSRKLTEVEDSQSESLDYSMEDCLDSNVAVSPTAKPSSVQVHIANAVKTFRKVKMIKIEEQNSNTSETVILERCKDPETCPANRQSMQDGEKPRPHFHKVYVNNSVAATSISAKQENPEVLLDSENTVSNMRLVDDRLDESCEDSGNVFAGDDEKTSDNMHYRMERYLINVTRRVPKELTTTSRYSENIGAQRKNEIARLITSDRNIRSDKGETTIIGIPDYISKKHPSTTELVKEYYRTKDERIFDRCAYLNCKNGRYANGARLFRFPQFTDPRLNTWIKNAGNPRMLYWSSATIRRAGLCGEHFTDESFFNETRQRLLRSALPKPFYLERKNVSGTKLQNENLTRDDLIRIFEGLDEDVCDETDSARIDLPETKMNNREDIKIKYPFEDADTPDATDKEEQSESFDGINVKKELFDENEEDDVNELPSIASEQRDIKIAALEEIEDDPLLDEPDFSNNGDFDMEPQEDSDRTEDDIQGILALEQQKVELCNTIKQFSTKLKNARLRKKKLRSQLLAYSELKIH